MERETNNSNNNNNEASTLLQYCSSIALLQERFKQLQKVKEMREKSRSGCFNILSRRDEQRRPPAAWLFHAELTRASPPGLDTSCNNKNRENAKELYGELDVDTSLHL